MQKLVQLPHNCQTVYTGNQLFGIAKCYTEKTEKLLYRGKDASSAHFFTKQP